MRSAGPLRTLGVAVISGSLGLCATGGMVPAVAQTTSASTAVLGTGDNYSVFARGFGAIGANPAGLGMPDGPRVSFALPVVEINQGLGPLTLRDVNEYAGVEIPTQQREEWLQRIEGRGGQTGSGRLDVSALALNLGGLGFQHTSMAVADATLPPAIAELVLFGNAGRTGVPTDVEFAGSALDLSAFSSFNVAYGFQLPLALTGAANEALAIGVTGRYTVGHFFVAGRDLGSVATSDPLEMSVRFPVVESDPDLESLNLGDGMGMDVGALWQSGPWAVGATVRNVFNTFAWDTRAFRLRPGTALFDREGSESDFDPVPFEEAPQELRDEITQLGFRPGIELGLGFRPSERFALTADYRSHAGEGIRVGPRTHVGAGVELKLLSFLPIQAGAAYVSDGSSDGVQFAGGVGLVLGPVNLGTAALVQSGDVGDGATLMVGLSFGGR